MDSVVINVEEDASKLGDDLDGYSRRLVDFFTGPGTCKEDYANDFLMFLGEDDGFRIPQGLLRECQNLRRSPVEVMRWGLGYVFSAVRAARPAYSEQEFGEYLDMFLTDETGYIGRKIAQRAQAAPYFGRVARSQLPEGGGPFRVEGVQSSEGATGKGQ